MKNNIQFVARFAGGVARVISDRSVRPARLIQGSIYLFLLIIGCTAAAIGQALPAAEASPISTGFALPTTAGTLQYSISASESLSWGYYGTGGAASASNVTGNLGYISNSKRDPFSAVFSGGRSLSTSGQPSYSYLNLGVSQVISAGHWGFVFSDSVSYMPGTPVAGLSGVAGTGDLGLNPIQVGPATGQGVLTNFSSRVANTVAGTIQRQLTGRTSINASGSYGLARFLSSTGGANSLGLDSDSETASGGVSHQFNVRNSLGVNYGYSTYSFLGTNSGIASPGFTSQTASVQFSHQFTRKLGLSASGGPQFTKINSSGSSSTSLFADVSASWAGQFSHVSASYVRSTNSGYGVIGGAISNGVQFAASHTFARVWSTSGTSSFTQSSSLPGAGASPYTFHTTLVGGQVSRAIARSLSAYGSYTLENQSSQGTAALGNVYTGLSQVLGFGVTFSPTSIHVGRP